MAKKSSLIVDIKPGETLDLGGLATISLVQKSGKAARLWVQADRQLNVNHSARPALAEAEKKKTCAD